MPCYYHVGVRFSCSACGGPNYVQFVVETLSSDPDAAAQATAKKTQKCATCGELAGEGTMANFSLRQIPVEQFVEWIHKHQGSLRTVVDRTPEN